MPALLPRSTEWRRTAATSPLLIQQRLIFDIATLRTRVRLVVLAPPCPLDVSPADFSRSAEMIERARQDARSFLDRLDPAGSTSRT